MVSDDGKKTSTRMLMLSVAIMFVMVIGIGLAITGVDSDSDGDTTDVTITNTNATSDRSSGQYVIGEEGFVVKYNAGRLPVGYTEVEYIESSTDQYIDTGMIASADMDWELKASVTSGGSGMWIAGCNSWIGIHTTVDDGKVYVASVNSPATSPYNDGIVDYNEIFTVALKGTTAYFNDEPVNTVTRSSSTNSLVLGGCHHANGTITMLVPQKDYYLKLWENDTLVFDGVPCIRNSDDAVGMYDLISNTFFGNSGTGSFTAGDPVYTHVLNTPVVTIGGSPYTGSTWSDGTLTIPADDINGAVTITETASAIYHDSNGNEYYVIDGTLYVTNGSSGTGVMPNYSSSSNLIATLGITETVTSFVIDSNMTNVGNYAFYNCTSLTSVTISNGVTSIGEKVYSGCTSLISLTIPDSVTSIGYYTFYNCISLTSVTIPNSVTSIGNGAFSECRNLALTSLPSGLTSINGSAFYGCTSLALTSLPSGVTSIAAFAFSGCTNLALTSLPSGITSIGSYAFDRCTSLALTSLPSGLTSISPFAFNGCTSLALTSLPSGITSINQSTFNGCTQLALTSLPSGLTSIGNSAFYGCSQLATLTIPSTVTSIGDQAFNGCTNLTSVTIEGTTPATIGANVFPLTTSLVVPLSSFPTYLSSWSDYSSQIQTTVHITITAIDATADKSTGDHTVGSDGFTVKFHANDTYTLTTPAVTIGGEPYTGFTYDEETATLTIPASAINGPMEITETTDPYIFHDTKYNEYKVIEGTLYIAKGDYGDGIIPDFKEGENIRSIDKSVDMPDFTEVNLDAITVIGRYAFSNLLMTDITMYDVVQIHDQAFYGCVNLASETLPQGLTDLGHNAFYNCRSLKITALPDTLTTIGRNAFNGCANILISELPSGIKTIESGTFSGCTNLRIRSLPDSVTTIGSYAFNKCTSLTVLELPDTITDIGNDAFGLCTDLLISELPSKIVKINNSTFYKCSKLALTSFPDGIETIGESAFSGCTSLALTTLPDSVTTIGKYAFNGCTSLALTTLPDGVTTIDVGVFYGCTSLTSFIIPSKVTKIDTNAFNRCTSLTSITIPDTVSYFGSDSFALGWWNKKVTCDVYGCQADKLEDYKGQYTTFNYHGGYKVTYTVGNDPVYVDDNYYGETVTVREKYEKTGYTIGDWISFDVELSEPTFTMPAKDVAITATSEPITYTVAFNGNGKTGGTDVDPFEATYDIGRKAPKNTWVRSYHTFECWNTKSDGTGDDYYVEDTIINLTAKQGDTCTLYAKWIKNERTVEITNDISKTYDGQTVSEVKYEVSAGGGTVTVSYKKDSGSYSTEKPKDAGEYTVRVHITDDGTYPATIGEKAFTIHEKEMIIQPASGQSGIYNGSLSPDTDIDYGHSGNIEGEVPAFSGHLEVDKKDKGNRNIVLGSLVAVDNDSFKASNYELKMQDTAVTYRIDARPLDDSMVKTSGEYTYKGVAQTVSYTVTDGSPSIIAETDYTVSGQTQTDAGEYTLTVTATSTGNYSGTASVKWSIEKVQLEVKGTTASDRTYDGGTDATTKLGTVIGIVEEEDVDISVVGTFVDKNAGEGKTVTLVYTMSGDDTSNYLKPVDGTTTANISKKDVKITGITASDRTYDGTTDATLDYTGIDYDGKLDGDGLSATATGTFEDKNVGVGKTVNIKDYILSGADKDNYNVKNDSQSVTDATISKLSISISSAVIKEKEYNGLDNDGVVTSVIFSAAVANNDLRLGTDYSASAVYASPDADDEAASTVSVVYGTTTAAGNFKLTATSFDTTGKIAKRSLTDYGDGTVKVTKEYDSTRSKGSLTGAITFSGKVGEEAISISAEPGEYPSSDAATGLTVTLSLSLNGETSVTKNYALSSQTYDFGSAEITKATQSISYEKKTVNQNYSKDTFINPLTETKVFGIITYTSSDTTVATVDSKGNVTMLKAGTATITANAADGGDNYTSASASYTLNIAKAPGTITDIEDLSKKYDGNAVHNPSCTASSTGAKTYEYLSMPSETALPGAPTDAGSYKVKITVAEDDRYLEASVEDEFTISQREITFTSASDSKVYDGKDLINHDIETTGDGFIGSEGFDITVTGKQTNVGSSKNTFTYEPKEGTSPSNYSINAVKGDLTVTAAEIKGELVQDGDLTYDSTAQTALTTGLTTVDGQEPTVIYSTDEGGTYGEMPSFTYARTYTVYYKANAPNHSERTGSVNIKIDPKELTVADTTVESKMYDGTKDASVSHGALSGIIEGDKGQIELRSSIGTFEQKNCGTNLKVTVHYTLTGARTTDYTIEDVILYADITVRTIRLVSESDTKVYDGEPLTKNKVKALIDGFIEGEGATYTVTGTQTNYGTSYNTFSYELNDGTDAVNYNILEKEGTLTVERRPATVTSVDKTREYGSTDPKMEEIIEGMIGTDEPDYDVIRSWNSKSDVGAYDITPSGMNEQGNYYVTFVTGTFTITPAAIQGTLVQDGTLTYTGSPQTADTKGLTTVLGQELSIKYCQTKNGTYGDMPSFTDAGDHIVYFKANAPNHSERTGNLIITIGKAEITGITTLFNPTYDATEQLPDNSVLTYTGFSVRPADGKVTIEKAEGFDCKSAKGQKVTVTISGDDNFKDYSGDVTYTIGVRPLDIGLNHSKYDISNEFSVTYITEYGTDEITLNIVTYSPTANTYTYTDGELDDGKYIITSITGDLAANYSVHSADIFVIEKRDVTLTSATASKEYDGEPLTDHSVTVTGDGFASGHGAEYTFTGSQTAVGSSSNTFSYELSSSTNPDNYNIKTANGTLTVSVATPKASDFDFTVPSASDLIYDGQVKSVEVTKKSGIIGMGDITATKYYLTYFGGTLLNEIDASNVIDVRTYYVGINVGAGTNYTYVNYLYVGSFDITPSELQSVTLSKTYTYNGSAIVPNFGDLTIEAVKGTVTSSDVTITGSDNVNAGTSAKVIVTAKANGNFSGSAESIFTITAAKLPDISGCYEFQYDGGKRFTYDDFPTDIGEETVTLTFDTTSSEIGTYTYGAESDGFQVSISDTNYAIDKVTGTVKIIARSFADATFDLVSSSGTYDGKAHSVSVKDVTLTGYELKASDFKIVQPDDMTNAGSKTIRLEGIGNFTGTTDISKIYIIEKATPTKDEFDYAAPTGDTYDGTIKSATVLVKSTVIGMETPTVNYYLTYSGGVLSDKILSSDVMNADIYYVGIDVSEGFNYTSIGDLYIEQFEIKTRSITLTSASDSKSYDGTALTNGTVEITDGTFVGEEGVESYDVTGTQTVAGSSDNEFTYILKDNTNKDNYTIVKIYGTLTVNAATPTASDFDYTAPSKLTYSGKMKTATVTTEKSGMGEITIVYYIDSGLTSYADPIDARQYWVAIDVAEGTGYEAADKLYINTFTVEQATMAVIPAKSYDYTGKETYTLPDFETGTNGETVTLTYTPSSKDAGTYGYAGSPNFTLSYSGTQNYSVDSEKVGDLTIEKVVLTPHVDLKDVTDKIYDGTDTVGGTPALTLEGAVNDEEPTASAVFALDSKNVGTKKVNAKNITLNGTWGTNYSLSDGSTSATSDDPLVTVRSITVPDDITWSDSNPTYDGTDHTYDITSSFTGVGSDGTIALTITLLGKSGAATGQTAFLNAGTYTATGTNTDTNYVLSAECTKEYTVDQKGITGDMISVINGPFTYNGEDHTVKFTVADSTSLTADDWEDAPDTELTKKDAGTYSIRIVGKSNYTGTASKEWSIGKLSSMEKEDFNYNLTSKTYSGAEQGVTVISKIADLGTVTVKYDGSETVAKNAKIYVITVDVAESSNNDAITDIQIGDYEIVARSFADAVFDLVTSSEIYIGSAYTVNVKDVGLTGYTIIDTDYEIVYPENMTDAGDKTIKLKGVGNFTGETSCTRTFTIVKRTVVFESESATKTYDGTPLTRPVVTISEGSFATGEGASYCATGTISQIGSVPNTIEYTLNEGTKADNYDIDKIEGTLTIKRGTITVTPLSGQWKSYSEKDQYLSYTYSGQAESEIPGFCGDLSRQTGEEVGSYLIYKGTLGLVINGQFDPDNYYLKVTEGITFEIVPKTISAADFTIDLADETYTGDSITKTVTSQLVLDRDYTAGYKNNRNAGIADIIIEGKGNYSGSIYGQFNILKRTVDAPEELYYVETGSAINFDIPTNRYYTEMSGLPHTGIAPGTYTFKLEIDPNCVWSAKDYKGDYNVFITLKETKHTNSEGKEDVIVTGKDGVRKDVILNVSSTSDVSDINERYDFGKETAKYCYDIKFYLNGSEVQPTDAVTVKMYVPDDLHGLKFDVYHIHSDTITKLDKSVDGDYVTVTVGDFSEFVFVSGTTNSGLAWIAVAVIIVALIAVSIIVYAKVRKARMIRRLAEEKMAKEKETEQN